MNSKFPKAALLVLFSISIPLSCAAQDQNAPPSWKDTNDAAIQSMRAGKLEEAEKLFQKALSQCSSPDGKSVIQDNLNVLYEKEGKRHEGAVSENNQMPSSSTDLIMGNGNDQNANNRSQQIGQVLAQIDEQIKKADAKGDLEMLQVLFQKKMDALKVRDSGETLDYAYVMHFRAQVLHELHRDDEANNLENKASHLRDQLRRLQATAAAPPSIPKSGIKDLNFSAVAPPSSRTIQPYQENYASATPPPNQHAPRSWRNFMNSNAGNTSGYLNGNPNQPPNGW